MSSRSPPRKYQIGPPARPLVRSERRSPGRLSRGFNPEPPPRIARWSGRPGGVRRFANIPSSSHRLLLLELQFIVTHIDQDRVALAEMTLQYPHGQRIQHAALNRPLQRPGAEHRIEAFGHEEAASRIGELDVNLPLFEPLEQSMDLDVHDPFEVLEPQRVEEDDLVYPVDELWAEMLAQ